MTTMRAAVLEAEGKVEVGDVDIEDPRPGEVLVKVTDCGVCHSDLRAIDGSFPAPARRCSATRPPASSRRSVPASPACSPATRSC